MVELFEMICAQCVIEIVHPCSEHLIHLTKDTCWKFVPEFGGWLSMKKTAFTCEAAHILNLRTVVVWLSTKYSVIANSQIQVFGHSLQYIHRYVHEDSYLELPPSPNKHTHLQQNCSSSASASNKSLVERRLLKLLEVKQIVSSTQGGLHSELMTRAWSKFSTDSL